MNVQGSLYTSMVSDIYTCIIYTYSKLSTSNILCYSFMTSKSLYI